VSTKEERPPKNRRSSEQDTPTSLRDANSRPFERPDYDRPGQGTEGIRQVLYNLQTRQVEQDVQKAELNRINSELQEIRDKFSALFDNAPVGYATLDQEGRIIEANLMLADILGKTKTELSETEFAQYLLPESREIFFTHLKNVLLSGARQECEVGIQNVGGTVLFAGLTTIGLPDSMGNLCRFQTTISDVSDRRKNEELVQFQNTLTETSYDAIIATDKELNITHWNTAAETMFGWSAGEILGNQTSIETRAMIMESLTNDEVMTSLSENGTWTGDIASSTKYGTKVNTHLSIGVLWDNTGNFNGLVAIHHQLEAGASVSAAPNTEEIESEVRQRTEDLAKANRILQQEINIHKKAALLNKESEGKNRDLVDNIKLGIFRCTPGPKGKFLEVNRAMEELTGYSRDALLQMDVCALLTNSDETVKFTNEVNITDWKVTRELNLKRKDGTGLSVAETVVAIRFESGATQYFDGILEDITERKQAQLQIQQSLHRLQKTIKEIIQAMAYIGEVRDPYTAGHQRRVAQLSFELGKMLGLKEDNSEGLTMAAFVHDIGKILVPADILSKPGKLTKPELDMLKDHTQIGYEILKTIEFPWPLAKIVLQHHERMNGSGYPGGLSGEQIILEARILAVADVVEAMSSHRPYRPALGIEKALEEINQNRGILYDARVVDACVKLFTDKGFSLN
jgi:PAS domain S-box-containing protein